MIYRLIIALLMFLFMASSGYSQSFRDNNNMRIGTASGVNAKYTAVLFFFNLL
jgi:hypothetical protein